MISFKEFLEEHSKKYVCLHFDEKTNASLCEYTKKYGFDTGINYKGEKQSPESFDFHITVYHTTNRLKSPNIKESITPFNVTPNKMELLGKDRNIPVVKLEVSGELKAVRDWFTSLGFKDEWPSWKPHISLSYDKKQYDLSKIKLPDFPLTVVELTVENQ